MEGGTNPPGEGQVHCPGSALTGTRKRICHHHSGDTPRSPRRDGPGDRLTTALDGLLSRWGPGGSSRDRSVNYFQVQAYLSEQRAPAQQASLGRKKPVFTCGNLIQVLSSFLLSSSFYCKLNSVVGFIEAQNRKDICCEVTQDYDVD